METKKKKCSLKEHSEINANVYCKKCEIYMCNKCEVHHSKLHENHQDSILSENIDEINDEFCEEGHHNCDLKYFCKNHNILCCASCITKIKGKGNGQHTDCKICFIEEVMEEKKKGIKNNIKLLEELSSKFDETYNNIKKIYDQINENKEKVKIHIQKVFTNIRNILNNREDELLLKIDEYDKYFLKDNILKDIEKLPDKIKLSLQKSKNIEEFHNFNLIKECIGIENNIRKINDINSNINKIYKSADLKMQFIPEDYELNKFIENIKTFGNVTIKNGFFNVINESSIIRYDIDSIELISNWIEEAIKKNDIKYELLFKMSENGNNSEDFHKYCDNKGPTLTLVKTTNNKIFGGFTPLNWNSQGRSFKDIKNQTFIFSLDSKKKYNMINKNGNAITCYKDNGPNFGSSDFSLRKNMLKGDTYSNISSNFLSNNNLGLTGGIGEFEVFETNEIEVYKIIY